MNQSLSPKENGSNAEHSVSDRLLSEARDQNPDSLGNLLELYRKYLTTVAATQLDRRLQCRVSPSDIVQETMLAAHRDFGQFRGQSSREFMVWLRQILIHSLQRAVQVHLKAKRRDVRRQRSMEQGVSDESAIQLANVIADAGPSPSTPARHREVAADLASQLAMLSEPYRDVIVLRNLKGLSFDEIAEQMDRKPGSVRMLWLRAIEKLRTSYQRPIE